MNEAEKQKIRADFIKNFHLMRLLRELRDIERQHKRNLRNIKYQGWAMQALIIGVILFYVFGPLWFVR